MKTDNAKVSKFLLLVCALLIFLIASSLMNTSSAQSLNVPSTADSIYKHKIDENKIYSYSDLYKMYVDTEIKSKINDINIKNQRELWEYVTDGRLSKDYPNVYKPLNERKAYDKLQDELRGKALNQAEMRIDFEKSLMDVVIAKNNLEYAQKNLEYVIKTHEAQKLKYELKKITSLELLDSENKLTDANTEVINNQNQLTIAFTELKLSIGVNPAQDININFGINIKEKLPIIDDSNIASIVEKQDSMIKARNTEYYDSQVFKRIFDYKGINNKNDSDYKQAENNHKISQMKTAETYYTEENKIISMRNKALNQYKKYELALENYKLKQKQLNNKKIEFDIGKISKLDFEKYELELQKSYVNLSKEIASYNTQYDKLMMLIK